MISVNAFISVNIFQNALHTQIVCESALCESVENGKTNRAN